MSIGGRHLLKAVFWPASFAAILACAAIVPARTDTMTLQDLLASRRAAMKALGVHSVRSVEVTGSINGGGVQGSFHAWKGQNGERLDEWVGPRFQSWVRAGSREYAVDEDGNVSELLGRVEQHRGEQRFILDDGFAREPQFDRLLGRVDLPDGRSAYSIQVAIPGDPAETVAIDAKTFMIDRISYDAEDGALTFDYYDYKVFSGALVARTEIDSNGDHNYDLDLATEDVLVDKQLAAAVFATPVNTQIQCSAPVTVPLQERGGHYYTRVRIQGREYTFLLDSGAQTIVFDEGLADRLHLQPSGHLEVVGANRTRGLGLAPIDGGIQIGTATLPLRIVTIFDARDVSGAYQADGVLGYPFFASAEVSVDAAGHRMTFGKPGTLRTTGSAIPVDVDRQSIELHGKVDGVDGRFLLDTGNGGELLLFTPFVKAHPELITTGQRRFVDTYGVGGWTQAFSTQIDELDFGSYRFFNRNADVMLENNGAFSGRLDAGNIGMGVMRNLIVTFDVANAKIYASASSAYDDGRYRGRTESSIPM